MFRRKLRGIEPEEIYLNSLDGKVIDNIYKNPGMRLPGITI